MATATLPRFLLSFSLLILILLQPSHAVVDPHRTISATGGSIRSLRGVRRSNQIVDCSEVASKLLCSQKPKQCRWCRSDDLDDTCFSKSEALRLPPQTTAQCGDRKSRWCGASYW